MSLFTKAVVAACAGAAIFAAATPASAQSYYIRERLPGATAAAVVEDPASYSGTWSSGSWTDAGSCNGTTKPQIRTATCSTASCDPATKPSTTQSVACSSGISNCTLSVNTSTASVVNFRQIGPSKGVATLSDAKAACDALAVGLCYVDYWTNDPGKVKANSGTPYWVYAMDSGSTVPIFPTGERTIYAGTCVRR